MEIDADNNYDGPEISPIEIPLYTYDLNHKEIEKMNEDNTNVDKVFKKYFEIISKPKSGFIIVIFNINLKRINFCKVLSFANE